MIIHSVTLLHPMYKREKSYNNVFFKINSGWLKLVNFYRTRQFTVKLFILCEPSRRRLMGGHRIVGAQTIFSGGALRRKMGPLTFKLLPTPLIPCIDIEIVAIRLFETESRCDKSLERANLFRDFTVTAKTTKLARFPRSRQFTVKFCNLSIICAASPYTNFCILRVF